MLSAGVSYLLISARQQKGNPMGPYYDRATLDRIENDIEHDRMIELIRMHQGFGHRPRAQPAIVTAVLVCLLFVPML